MQRDGHLCAEECRIRHILQQSVAGCHISRALVHCLAEIIDQVFISILLDNDQALHAEGLGIIVHTGVGAGRDLGLDVSRVVGKDLVKLLVGDVEDVDVLGSRKVQLAADRQSCETESCIQDTVSLILYDAALLTGFSLRMLTRWAQIFGTL